jgi:hypothetical protein
MPLGSRHVLQQQFLLDQIANRHNLRTANYSKLPRLARVQYRSVKSSISRSNYRSQPFLFDELDNMNMIKKNEFVVSQVEEGVCMISNDSYNYWIFSQFLIYKSWDFLSDERKDPIVELSVIKFLDMFYSTT